MDTLSRHKGLSWATDRRTLLHGAAAGVLSGLAGCSLLPPSTQMWAAPVRLADAADRGYRLVGTARPTMTSSFDSRDEGVNIVSFYADYEHESGLSVGLVNTVETGVVNPIASTPLAELLTAKAGERFAAQLGIESDFARGPEAIGSGEGELFGETVEFTTFAGVTEQNTWSPRSMNTFVLVNAVRMTHNDEAILVGHGWRTDVEDSDQPFIGEDGYVDEAMVEATGEDFAELLPLVRYGSEPSESSEPT